MAYAGMEIMRIRGRKKREKGKGCMGLKDMVLGFGWRGSDHH